LDSPQGLELKNLDPAGTSLVGGECGIFSPKVRAAAYARSKSLSSTFVLMPCYTELFFDMIEKQVDEAGNTKLVLQAP
jgi:hypothetical protein